MAPRTGPLRPLGPPHSPKELIVRGGGAFRHWRGDMSDGFEATVSRLWFSLPSKLALKDLRRLVAVVFPLAPPVGFIEVIHKPDKPLRGKDKGHSPR